MTPRNNIPARRQRGVILVITMLSLLLLAGLVLWVLNLGQQVNHRVSTQNAADATARAAGVPCALVTFGPEGRAVADLDPEALLDDYADLYDLAGSILRD